MSGELELKRAGVLAPLGVDREKAAAGDDAGVDRQPDAGGRLERDIDLGRPDVAAPGREARA